MTESTTALSRNNIAFIGLAHEYCVTLENTLDTERTAFIDKMAKLLPRLYICALDLAADDNDNADQLLESFADEARYETIRSQIATLMEADDDFLEVFTPDMQFSEGAITATISESLADIYQDLYDCIGTVRENGTDEVIAEVLAATRAHFDEYWGQILCNVMRAIHSLRSQYQNEPGLHHHHHHDDDCDCGHHHHDDDCDCGHHHHHDE